MANKDYLRSVSVGIQTNPDQGVPAESPNLDHLFSRWSRYMTEEAPDVTFRCTNEHYWQARPENLHPKFTIEAGGVPRFAGLEQMGTLPLCPVCHSISAQWYATPEVQRAFEAEMRRRCSRPRYIRGPGD